MLHGLDNFIGQGENTLRVDEKGAPFFGQTYFLSCSIEQADADLFFQISNLARERRLG